MLNMLPSARLWVRVGLWGLLSMLLLQPVWAVNPRMQLNVSVEVLQPTCTFNNGQRQLSVDFGDRVVISQIDGENYKKSIPYSLRCSGYSSTSMRFKLSGDRGYNSQYLTTNKTGLGLAFYMGGRALPLNEWRSFNYLSPPTLESAPIKQSGANLSSGPFSSTATLLVEYQ